jgi:hypothetical protein
VRVIIEIHVVGLILEEWRRQWWREMVERGGGEKCSGEWWSERSALVRLWRQEEKRVALPDELRSLLLELGILYDPASPLVQL